MAALVLLQWFGMVGAAQAQQVGADFDHTSTGFQISGPHAMVRCETCHINGVFKGTPRDCQSCHGHINARSSVVQSVNHIPTTAACETCHLPEAASFNSALFTHVGVAAGSCSICHGGAYPQLPSAPRDATHAQAAAAGQSCDQCHTVSTFSNLKPPVNHIPVSSSAACQACHTSTDYSVMPTVSNIHANAQSTSGNCAQCHSSSNAATYNAMPTMVPQIVAPPATHLPLVGTQACEACHVGPGSSIAATPVQTGANFRGSMFNHAGINSGCVTCHGPGVGAANFYGVTSIVTMPPTSPSGPNTHIPSSTACENCHLGSLSASNLAGLLNSANQMPVQISGNPTRFQYPLPTKDMVHAGVTNNCALCHEAGTTWLGMGLYPMVGNAGFQTRPQPTAGVANQADPAHPTAGDCSQCHAGISFAPSGYAKPSNHIPVSAASTCQSCHTGSNYAVMPAIADIHANAPSSSTNCAQCHSSANAATYNTMPTMSPQIVAPPANHIAMGNLGCENCHVTAGGISSSLSLPVANGARFSNAAFSHSGIVSGCDACHGAAVAAGTFYGVTPRNIAALTPAHVPNPAGLACETCHTNSIPTNLVALTGAGAGQPNFSGAAFSHSGISSGCATCHGQGITAATFYGINSIVVMPPSAAPGTSSHIPTTAACESCHQGSTPSALVAGNATRTVPGTGFQTPVPTTGMIHAGITSGCAACHEYNYTWVDAGLYPLNPSTFVAGASYTGLQTRPMSFATINGVIDANHPTAGDCSNCHGSTTAFTVASMPSNHIPIASGAACTNCHESLDFSVVPTLNAIHANAPSSTTNCAQCHSAAAAPTFALPAIGFAVVGPPSNHIAMGGLGCESCHVSSAGVTSSLSLPVMVGAKFSNSAFSHSGIAGNCASCHGAGVAPGTFYGVTPKSTTGLAPAHVPNPAALDCGACHTATPTALVPLSGATGSSTFGAAGFSHSGISSGCAACHGQGINGSSFYGISNIVVMPSSAAPGPNSHIPSTAACESCHQGSTPSAVVAANATRSVPGTGFMTPVPTTAMIHNGITSGCAACHEYNYNWLDANQYPLSPSTFVAGATYTGLQTRPMSFATTLGVIDAGHPTAGDCSNCHASTTAFTTPSMPSNHIPVAAGAACQNCHTVSDYSAMPTLTAIHANAPSSSTNCAQCHSSTNAATYNTMASMNPPIVAPPTNHIAMGNLGCESCHVTTTTPSSLSLPVVNGARFSNSAFVHTGITGNCASCHDASVSAGTFYGVTPKTNNLTPAHVSILTPMDCSTCHTNNIPSMPIAPTGATGGQTTFAGGKFSHGGATWGCVTCHGPSVTGSSFYGITSIVVMPPTSPVGPSAHMPTSTTCENCHVGSVPSGLVAGNATKSPPGTGFLLPTPSSAMIHNGVTGNCASCHDTNDVWVSASQYPITTSAPFVGFQTRPQSSAGTFFVKDAAHPTTGDCSNCHGNFNDFTAPSKPSNHIPVAASAACSNCHTSTDYSVMPTLANIHAFAPSSTTNCAQCHSAANAATYAIPAIGFNIVAPASNHVPMGSAGCETCHVGSNSSLTLPVQNGAHFSGSAFSHSGITSGCAACHGAGISGTSFQGITAIVAIPASTTTPGASNHIPYTAACESCHAGSTPSALVPGVATKSPPGTLFATPAPSTTMIHAGITSGCSTCHETPNVWLGMSPAYNITTTAPYQGFQTRPQSSAGTFYVADSIHPTTGDCSNCHNSYTDFSAYVLPTNHIPVAASSTCANCHTVANYATMPTLTNIHKYAPSQTGNCQQCHSNANAATYNTLAGMNPPIKTMGADHMPNPGNLDCVACHAPTVSIPSLPVQTGNAFSNASFVHTGITGSCAQCHGTTAALTFSGTTGATPSHPAYMGTAGQAASPNPSAAHIGNPGNLDCVSCHTVIPTAAVPYAGGGTSANFAAASFSHGGITTGCAACHGSGVGSTSFKGINKIVVLSSYTMTQGASSHIPAPTDASCETCHLGTTPAAAVAANAATTTWGATKFLSPAPSTAMIHTGITSNCASCHESNYTWVDMAQYPRNPSTFTAGAIYTGFQTRPGPSATLNGVIDSNHPSTGDCSNCHGSTADFSITAMPSNHIPIGTGVSCDKCHTAMGTNNDFSAYPTITNIHLYAPSTTTNCAQCHSSANAAIYNGLASMASQPIKTVGTNHVPLTLGTAACEVCHTGAGTGITSLPVVTGKTFAGAIYSHSGISGSCNTCHLATNVPAGGFQGVTNLLAIPASSATPGATTHIPFGTQDCAQCHLGNMPTGNTAIAASPVVIGTGGGTTFKITLTAASNSAVHASVGSACMGCHEKNYVWLGMSNAGYLPSSTATGNSPYTGFLTRPNSTASSAWTVVDAAHTAGALGTADCSQCHGTVFTSFTAAAQPNGHVPTTSMTCSICHATPGEYGTPTVGSAATMHPYFTLPAGFSNGGALVKIAAVPSTGAGSCANCHVAHTGTSGTSAPFAGCTTVQASCASPVPITYQPTLTTGSVGTGAGTEPAINHVPIAGLDCMNCHTSYTAFTGTKMGATGHSNANSVAKIACQSCHLDSSATMKTSSGAVTTNYGPAWTNASLSFRPTNHTGSKAYPNDCSNCHSYNAGGFGGRSLVRPTMRRAAVNQAPTRQRPAGLPGVGARGLALGYYDHQGVQPGQCRTCHDGRQAAGMPPRHLMVSSSCDTCHRTTAWTPAYYSHAGVSSSTCMACHNGVSATARPSGHFLTTRACDACHTTRAWTPVSYNHLSPSYTPSGGLAPCISCHITNSEIIPRQLRGLTRSKPTPLGP